MAEIEIVPPKLIVCLGASAAQSVLGRKVQVSAERGRLLRYQRAPVFVTFHPSAILRVPDEQSKRQLRAALVSDLAYAKHIKETV